MEREQQTLRCHPRVAVEVHVFQCLEDRQVLEDASDWAADSKETFPHMAVSLIYLF